MSIPLAFDRIDGVNPTHTLVFLHGILGRGNNLRTIAKRFVEAQAGWSALLVDLRGHGRSPKSAADPTIAAAAEDVLALANQTAPPVAAIAGHSLGGKVALMAVRIGGVTSLQHVVMIDSAPGVLQSGSGRDSATTTITTIASLPEKFSSRAEFTDALLAKGLNRASAQWLAQSTEQAGDQWRFALDLDEMRALILDYMALDLWSVVENPPGRLRVHLVIGDRSSSYSPADRSRAAAIQAANHRVTMDVLPAGHWVHVDDPDGLLRVLQDRIRD